jgi:hypothetical protein
LGVDHGAQEAQSSDKDLPGMRAPVRVAQEVGARLGQCRLLFGSLPSGCRFCETLAGGGKRLHILQADSDHIALAWKAAALHKDRAFQASSPKNFYRPGLPGLFFGPALV